jgi:hypothetical protein
MIQSTTHDLEDHLNDIKKKLQTLTVQAPTDTTNVLIDLRRIQEEKDSTEQCLEICANVSAHIDQIRFRPIWDESSSSTSQVRTSLLSRDLTSAQVMTLSTLKECSEKIADTVTRLRGHIGDANDRLQDHTSHSQQGLGADPEIDARRLQGERDSVEQCLVICTQASKRASDERVHVLEDITMAEDGQQVFVSTKGDLFNVKNASAGSRSIQFIGSTSDASLQHCFQILQRHAPGPSESQQ